MQTPKTCTKGAKNMYDVLIIGAGCVGSCVAYELSKYNLNVLLLEKENDISLGCSRANTAIVHGGYDPDPKTLMGKYNVKGAEKCMELVETLDVEFRKTGSLIVAFDEKEMATVQKSYERGLENGCPNMEMWDAEKIQEHEPNISKEIIGALWVPESGVINPWEFTIAHAEVAVREGVELQLNQKVIDLVDQGDHWLVKTETDEFETKYIVSAAGVHSDEIHNLVAEPAYTISPTKGQYFLLDRAQGEIVNSVIFPTPNERTKGILVSPTIHQNTLVGPDAEEILDKEDTSTSREVLDYVAQEAKRCVPSLDFRTNIRNYSGVRPNSNYGDFFVDFIASNILELGAIKSPGLTCSPVIAEEGVKMLAKKGLKLEAKEHWDGTRKVVRFKNLSNEDKQKALEKNPLYGRVICRCEHITEGEIIDAFNRGLPITSLDAVKRRCGTGMGRCQGGFCGPRIMEIIERETGMAAEDVLQNKIGSYIITGRTKSDQEA